MLALPLPGPFLPCRKRLSTGICLPCCESLLKQKEKAHYSYPCLHRHTRHFLSLYVSYRSPIWPCYLGLCSPSGTAFMLAATWSPPYRLRHRTPPASLVTSYLPPHRVSSTDHGDGLDGLFSYQYACAYLCHRLHQATTLTHLCQRVLSSVAHYRTDCRGQQCNVFYY